MNPPNATAAKLRLLNIIHEALQREMPEYGVAVNDIRKDAADMTVSVFQHVGSSSVRSMFSIKVKEVR